MKLLKKVIFTMAFTAFILATFQCASPKVASPELEQQIPFNVKPVSFQEWYSGIKIGTTGLNVFLPLTNVKNNVTIDSIYFRNLKGKLVNEGGKYVAILQNTTEGYTFKKSERPADYPFTLLDNECVISYTENGIKKFHKVSQLNEYAGAYYEFGPPSSLYSKTDNSEMATLDDSDEN